MVYRIDGDAGRIDIVHIDHHHDVIIAATSTADGSSLRVAERNEGVE